MNPANYAAFENANYDPQTNQILYGQSASAHSFGVSNGTCVHDQMNPLIYTPQYKCGFGVAGGNPSYMDSSSVVSKEGFENVEKINKGRNVTLIINIIIVILILYLVYYEFIEKPPSV